MCNDGRNKLLLEVRLGRNEAPRGLKGVLIVLRQYVASSAHESLPEGASPAGGLTDLLVRDVIHVDGAGAAAGQQQFVVQGEHQVVDLRLYDAAFEGEQLVALRKREHADDRALHRGCGAVLALVGNREEGQRRVVCLDHCARLHAETVVHVHVACLLTRRVQQKTALRVRGKRHQASRVLRRTDYVLGLHRYCVVDVDLVDYHCNHTDTIHLHTQD